MEVNTRKSTLSAIAFGLAALTATAPLTALASGQPLTENVHYGDLNLATPAGIEALDRRLDRAVKRVCGDASPRSLSDVRQVGKCRDETWQSIEADREFAIARATGRHDVQRAERASRGPSQVSLAE
jgi:UrcA family protein